MEKNQIVKLLIPGVFVGMVLGTVVGVLTGVDTTAVAPNVIGSILGAAIPTLLNGQVVLMMGSKELERKLSFGKALLRNLPFIGIGALLGLIYSVGILMGICKVDLCSLSVTVNTISNTILGIVVSTVLAYFAITSYAKDVKYTRKDKKGNK